MEAIVVGIIAFLSLTTAAVMMLLNFHKSKRETHDPYRLSKEERELLRNSYRWVIAPKVLSRDENATGKMVSDAMQCVPVPEDIECREKFLVNEVFPLVLATNTGEDDDHVFRSFIRLEKMALKMKRRESIESEKDEYLPLNTHGNAMRKLLVYGLVEVDTRWNYWLYKRSQYGKLYLHQKQRNGFRDCWSWIFN